MPRQIQKYFVAVDCVIFGLFNDHLETALIVRGKEPFKEQMGITRRFR
ncbi:MAG: hypothetical protein R3A13_07350 [Bdellovibrionota bacterium]